MDLEKDGEISFYFIFQSLYMYKKFIEGNMGFAITL